MLRESNQTSGKAQKKAQIDASYLKRIIAFQKYVAKHRFEIQKNYKFDREEANAR